MLKNKITYAVVIIVGIFIISIIFDSLSPDLLEQNENTVLKVEEIERKPDMIKIAESTDSAISDTLVSPSHSDLQEAETSLNISEKLEQPSSTDLSSDEREYNAMKVRERRKDAARQHKAYNRLRKEWRKELRTARIEARESGDYTYFNDLKSNPPDKNDMTLD